MKVLLGRISFDDGNYNENGESDGDWTVFSLHFIWVINQLWRGHQPGDFFCVEDNNNVHGKKDTAKNHDLCNAVRLEFHIYSINWPSSSPDLNPIENIWRVLKQKLRNRNPYGGWKLEDLKAAILDIWENEISIDLINRFVDTIPQRLAKDEERRIFWLVVIRFPFIA